jgi:hypothetical protein
MKPPRSSKREPYLIATPQTFASGSRKLKPYPQPDRVGCGSRSARSSVAELLVGLNDRLLVLAMNREREAAKPIGNTAELPLEPRLGEEPENDAVRALKHDVFGHAGRCFRPAELSIERGHPADVLADERDGADPCWKSHEQPAYRHNPDIPGLARHAREPDSRLPAQAAIAGFPEQSLVDFSAQSLAATFATLDPASTQHRRGGRPWHPRPQDPPLYGRGRAGPTRPR